MVLTVASGLRSDPITLRAAALTYLTVLSIIPLLTVVFSVSQVLIGRHEVETRLRDFLLQNLAVGAQASVTPYVSQFVQRASRIGGFGFGFLIFSSISLMANIEAAFNHIFRAPRARGLALRFGIYWCILTVGPALLALSLAATALTESRASSIEPLQHFFFLGPLLITYAVFTLLYLIVPNVPVKRGAALFGAFVAGSAWELAKVIYADVSANSVRNSTIYGSLSAVPIFLMWTYVSWILVLFGARLAYAAQISHPEGRAVPVETPKDRELLAARVMTTVAAAFQKGRRPPDTDRISLQLPAIASDVDDSLLLLKSAGLVNNLEEGGWVPSRALGSITLAEVRSAVRRESDAETVGDPALSQRWQRADAAADRELTITLEDLVRDSTLPG
jgi:membrane protein